VKVATQSLDRLATPLAPRREVEGHRQDDPPDGAGHAKEVEDEEDDDAPRALKTLLDEVEDVRARPVAGDPL